MLYLLGDALAAMAHVVQSIASLYRCVYGWREKEKQPKAIYMKQKQNNKDMAR